MDPELFFIVINGVYFTEDFTLTIKLQWELHFIITFLNPGYPVLQIVAHATTVQLSWHVQIA